ncbi:MAG: hypothetical protein LBQ55_03740 [Treponema sp.]|jgi:xylulokinase|nr:hypothetical protein [Treponema sp.]
MLLMGIDVGTTGAKAAVFDETGAQKGYGFEEYGIRCPRPGWAEQDAEEVWRITKKVIAGAAARPGPDIEALALSVQGDAVIPIGKDRGALAPAQLGMDYRGAAEAGYTESIFGGPWLFRHTGMRPHPLNSLVKILWIKNHQPELFEKTWKFATYGDYILGKLGSDDMVIDYTMASRTMALDIRAKDWSGPVLDRLGIPEEKLARVTPSARVVGRLPASLAEELGIKAGTLIVSGGHDQTCAALGAGIVGEDTALDSHGTAEVVSAAFFRPRLDGLMYDSFYPCYLHAVSDMYFTFSLNHTGGILLKWFVENFCGADAAEAEKKGERLYEFVLREGYAGAPSPVMVLPHFNGSGTPTCSTGAKGAILGLTMGTTRHDIARAINEALSFELRINLETLDRAGIAVSRLRCAGGGARSPIGLRSKADITGRPFSTLKVREAACLGGAMLAGMAAGIYKDAGEAARIVQTDTTWEPDMKNHRIYEERFDIYKRMYDTLTVKKLIGGL